MSTDDTRRKNLLQLGVAGAAGLLAACKKRFKPAADDPYSVARDKPYVPGAERWATHEERWANTTCGQCPAGCGVRIRVVEGRAVRVEGNPENPLNQGGVGPRGLSSLQALYDPDRITGPMIRRGGTLEKATWDEAIDRVVTAIRGRGRELLILSGLERGIINDLFRRFAAAVGGARFVDGRSNHSGPIAGAMDEMFGVREIPAYDWGGARTVLSLEAGLIEDSCQAVYFTRMAAERRGHPRARIVHASPAHDLAAHAADQWIQIRPGTSGALALGLAHLIIEEGRFDRATLDRAKNRAAFEALVAGFTPERTAEITGVAPPEIARLARALAHDQPSFALIDDRTTGFTNGGDNARAALALNAVLGAVEARSGGVRLPSEAPLRPWPEVPGAHVELAGLDAALEALESEQPPKLAMIHYANPAFTRARPDRWRAALDRLELVVSFSPFLDETTAGLADVVLPDHTYLERREDAGAAPGLPRAVVGVRQPVIAPLHDTRATGDVVVDLARRLGGPIAAAMAWRSFADAVDERLLGLHDADRGSVRADGDRGFLDALFAAGVWHDLATPPPRAIEPALPARWNEPAWSGDAARFPLQLLVYRPLGHAPSSASSPWLQQLAARPGSRAWERLARVHPDSAPGLVDGDTVDITSERGSIAMPVVLDRRVAPGVIAVPIGGGHTAFGRFAAGRGANPIELLAADVLCGTRVRIGRRS